MRKSTRYSLLTSALPAAVAVAIMGCSSGADNSNGTPPPTGTPPPPTGTPPPTNPPGNPSPPPPAATGSGLNDTGVLLCVDGGGVEFDCAATQTSALPGQDAKAGRDVDQRDDSDGRAGFAFSKIDASGAPLVDQATAYVVTPWDCVQDSVTGLVWEIKTNDGGLRDLRHTYRWREQRRGEPPSETGEPVCTELSECSATSYVEAVNARNLCGRNDWRVPDRHELFSIVDFGSPTSSSIDESYFPNTPPEPYWSASRDALTASVKFVEFDEGISAGVTPATALRIRLVSGGN
ncbi:MAG: DUF1566 domain-containing protein [Steroidobacteraceae bacterium]